MYKLLVELQEEDITTQAVHEIRIMLCWVFLSLFHYYSLYVASVHLHKLVKEYKNGMGLINCQVLSMNIMH